MEFNNTEVLQVERAISQRAHEEMKLLDDLQLALVGGGSATVDFG